MEAKDVNSNTISAEVSSSSSSAETSTPGLVDKALEAVAALKAENDRREKLLLREEELHARAILGGRSSAGTVTKILTEEEKAIEEAKAFLSKTGLNPFK